jgi:hypothetical protein
MILVREEYVVALSAIERDALLEALDDAINRYEAADEHVGNTHYSALRELAELLEGDLVAADA